MYKRVVTSRMLDISKCHHRGNGAYDLTLLQTRLPLGVRILINEAISSPFGGDVRASKFSKHERKIRDDKLPDLQAYFRRQFNELACVGHDVCSPFSRLRVSGQFSITQGRKAVDEKD